MSEPILFKEESYAIQGAIFEVYREPGCGFLESVDQECLEREKGTARTANPVCFAGGTETGLHGGERGSRAGRVNRLQFE